MMVDTGKPEILERRARIDELQDLFSGGLGGDMAGPYLVQQLLQVGQG